MRVLADLNVSLDGFASTADGTADDPMGEDWYRLVRAYTATRTFQQRVLGDSGDSGTTGVDDSYAASYFRPIGAEIMGAGMFGLDLHRGDLEWRGWWGEDPPFHVPVFVLTHEQRPSLEMEGGTTFHFIAATPRRALDLAIAEADGLDVRIGGGPTVVRDYLKAGLVDELHVAISPIVIGGGVRLWDDLRGLERDFTVTAESAESGTTHLTFTRLGAGAASVAEQPWRPLGQTL